MSRTRIVFFAVLAVFLALMAAGLGAQVVRSQLLQQIYVTATIFAAGVVLLDLFGLFGHQGDAAHDTGDLGGSTDHSGHDGVEGGNHHGTHDDPADHPDHGDHGHPLDQSQSAAAPLISALTYLRLLVYFCLGFGPVGWVAMASGRTPLVSLALAAPFGIGAVFLAQAFFRFQRKDTDSRITGAKLVAQSATVIVPLDATTMGKVRLKTGMNVEDLYALADDPDRHFEKGAAVRIARVTDECVYVR